MLPGMTNVAALAVEQMIAAIIEERRINIISAKLAIEPWQNGIEVCRNCDGRGRTIAYIQRGTDGDYRVVSAAGSRVQSYPDRQTAVRAVLDGKFGY